MIKQVPSPSATAARNFLRHFDRADLVIEAVFENLEVKHKVIKEIEKHTPAHCIIATNTSAIPIADVCLAFFSLLDESWIRRPLWILCIVCRCVP